MSTKSGEQPATIDQETVGIVNTYGAFQTFYETGLLKTETASNIAWIGSIQAFLLMLIGVLTGPLFDMGYFYALEAAGTFLIVFGMMMTSLSTKYYQVMLAQGLCVGLGCGCLFIPSVAICATYFTTRRATAMGIAAAGSSVGGIIYPTVFHRLEPRIGFPWATRVVAFITLATCIISMAVMRPRARPKPVNDAKPAPTRSIFVVAAFKEPPFVLFTIGAFLGFMGLYIPFYYVSTYALHHIGTNTNLSFYLLTILNAGSVIGRLIPNMMADRFGPLNILTPFSFLSAMIAFCWISIHSTGSIIAFSVFYGLFSGAFVSLPPATVASLSPNLSQVGSRMGTCFLFAGLGILIGNPIAGVIVNIKADQFLHCQVFCACLITGATIALFFARIAKTGLVWRAKA